ncbi:uncharacterized protein LOC110987268 [Acanthaster planci]|uniref:Uncharacterized protein LOC110987268 n=1 Tax=Acanthaster planci TaxID=133434 RepID=A0A8B7ZJ30_ACAPL|nr:uncharacterized protein LOC110987268 [Acanthaster planci]
MHSSTAVTLATCLIIATIVTQSATALAFQGSQDRAKRLFWVDKKSANGDSTVCVRASAADDIAECFISECIKRQLDCEMICDRQDCHSLCQTKKLGCAKACLTENSANNVLSQ